MFDCRMLFLTIVIAIGGLPCSQWLPVIYYFSTACHVANVCLYTFFVAVCLVVKCLIVDCKFAKVGYGQIFAHALLVLEGLAMAKCVLEVY